MAACVVCGFTNQHFYCLSVFTTVNVMKPNAALKPNTHRAVYVEQFDRLILFINLYSRIVDSLAVCLRWRASLGLQRRCAIPSFCY